MPVPNEYLQGPDQLQEPRYEDALPAGALAVDSYFKPRRIGDEEPKYGRETVLDRTEAIIKNLERAQRELPEITYHEENPRDLDAGFDIIKAMAEGRPPTLWVRAEDLTDLSHRSPGDPKANWNGREVLPLLKLFGKIRPKAGHQIQLNCLVNDLDEAGQRLPDSATRGQRIEKLLKNVALLGREDFNTSVIMASSAQLSPEDVIDNLVHSGNGVVSSDKSGKTSFYPNAWLDKWRSLKDGRDSVSSSLCLRINNGYPPYLFSVAPFLERNNDNTLHVLIDNRASEFRPTITALRAGDYRRPNGSLAFTADQIHSFRIRETSAAKVADMLHQQALRFRQSLGAQSFERLQSEGEEGYLDNYAGEIYPQDIQIIKKQMEVEADLAVRQQIDLGDPETLIKPDEAIHICYGANPYPAMLSSIYSPPGEDTILGWDVSPSAVEYNQKLRDDLDYHRDVRQRWHTEIMKAAKQLALDPKYQQIGFSPDLYADAEAGTRTQVKVERKAIEDLPPNTFKRIYTHFGPEATTSSRSVYSQRMRCIAESLQPEDGRLIMVLTEKSSTLYPGGKRKLFQAYSGNREDIELVLIDGGLEIEEWIKVDEDVPDEEKVRPGENFVLVVAKRRA